MAETNTSPSIKRSGTFLSRTSQGRFGIVSLLSADFLYSTLFIPAVEFAMDFLELGIGDVSVDLGGGDVSMAQQFLDGPDIGASAQEVGRKGVTQGMSRRVGRNSRRQCV